MEYFVSIIDSLAWPVTLIIIILILKNPLIDLVPYINKLKYKDLEIEFEKSLNELSQKTKSKNQNLEHMSHKEKININKIKHGSPRINIMESWLSLENTILSTLYHYSLIDTKEPIAIQKSIKILKEKEILSTDDVEIINQLKQLRNKAVHEVYFNISENEVKQFLEIARNQEDTIISNSWIKFGGCSH